MTLVSFDGYHLNRDSKMKDFIWVVILVTVILFMIVPSFFVNRYKYVDFPEIKSGYPLNLTKEELLSAHSNSSISPITIIKTGILLQPKSVDPNKSMIYVLSPMSNWKIRSIIRRTWASNTIHFSTIFVILSKEDTKDPRGNIMKEHHEYSDILYLDSRQTTSAMLSILKHFSMNKPQHPVHLIIVKDNIYLGTNTLNMFLESLQTKDFIGGDIIFDDAPCRSMECLDYVTKEQFPYPIYPRYPMGGLMILSSSNAEKFQKVSPYVKILKPITIYMGIIACKLDMPMIPLNKFIRNFTLSSTGRAFGFVFAPVFDSSAFEDSSEEKTI